VYTLNLLDESTMKKNKFDLPKSSTQAAEQFVLTVLHLVDKTGGDKTQVYPFLNKNQEKLDESCLEALPLAFETLTRESLPKRKTFFQSLKTFWKPDPQQISSENIAYYLGSFGNLIAQFPLGNRMLNLELSITAYELALQIYTREAFSHDWAAAQNNLGNAYRNRIRGERAENLEKAIAAYELALQVYTREAFPDDWVMTQGNLAVAFMQRASMTDNTIDLDAAIALFQAALKFSTPNSPAFISQQYTLGNALSRRYEHSQNPTDLQQSLQAYKIALEAISPEHYNRKDFWQAIPATQSILGSRLVRDGQWQEGLQLLLNSVSQLSTNDDRLAHANALFQTGRAHETLADWDNARLYYRDALRLYEHLKNEPGIAKSRTGLGGVLVSQGHLEKGISELAKAQESYHQLEQPAKAAEVESLRLAAQRVMESQMIEAYV
jgi:tetratricopeptide (TPR) repeat protein